MGSGSTTLGRELKGEPSLAHYAIYDLDDLRAQYKKKCIAKGISGKDFSRTYAKGYQSFIDRIVKKHSVKITISSSSSDYDLSNLRNIPSVRIDHPKEAVRGESAPELHFKLPNGGNKVATVKNKIEPVETNSAPNIIFIGLACYIFGEKYEYNDNWYMFPKVRFNLRADHKFYINIPLEQNIRQIYNKDFTSHLDLFCKWLKEKEDQIFRNLLEDENAAQEKIFKMLIGPFNFAEHKARIVGWAREHAKHDYLFAAPQKIKKIILNQSNKNIC